ncbi:MAG TPA: NAD(P)/FAD-dependent oxidoreductase [Solirubrobacteraceae bacterium]|nr:NAD(P)/FAD-dependent oxidoreductase [Solirubrobacteraceae bacterium]
MADAVVIGSGPNGLVAANALADAGWEVVVLEAAPSPGGAVRTEELTEPGFHHDVFSAFYPLAAASPRIRDLHLEDHGLRWRRADVAVASPLADGRCAALHLDLAASTASLDAFAPGDGAAWERLYERWLRLGGHVVDALMRPFPPVAPVLRLARLLGPAELPRFARFAVLPARRLAEEEFAGAGGGLLIAGNALHSDLSPEALGGGLFGWLLCGLAQQHGFPAPEGGAGRLADALVARLRARGGELRCDARVERVEVAGGRATGVVTASGERVPARRAVIADTGAPALYRDLLPPDSVPAAVREDVRRFDYDAGVVKVDWALDAPIPWRAAEARRAGTIHLAESIDDLTRMAAQVATGQLPDEPFLVMGQYACFDPTRAPAGRDTAWAYAHVPKGIDWDGGRAEAFADRMEEQVERCAPGFRGLVRARHVLDPPRMQARNANLVGGSINGGTAQLYQQVIFRPLPGLGRPETAVDGLYLGSASAHPGGGVHGGPGWNAARAALRGARLRRRPGRRRA